MKKCSVLAACALTYVCAQEGGIHYYDWDKLQTCQPLTYQLPSSETELINAITSSFHRGEALKVVGAGHSFSGIQLTDGNMLSLDRYAEVLSTEYLPDGGALVEVQAGIRLRDLNSALEERGLALPNLGATAAQSIAGAVATATHGTGVNTGSISSAIAALRIISSDGTVYTASASENKDLFDAARVGLGAVGVISTITLRVVPLWRMRKQKISYSLNQLLVDLPALLQQYERLQWSYTPYTDEATVIIREDTTGPIDPPVTGCWTSPSPSDCTDVSYKTMVDSKEGYENRALYTEMEMFIPVEYTADAIADFIAFQESVKDQHHNKVELFTGVRYVMADDILLSPLYHRNSSVISFIVMGNTNHTGDPREFEMYASGLEKLCEEKYEGRAHWGKVNYATAEYTAKAYGENLDTFRAVMARMDPTNIFTNSYLQERIGTV